ncbi:unnamed protein product, partial [marine sediment metagenome]
MLHNEEENPLYQYYDRLLDLAHKYDFALSLGEKQFLNQHKMTPFYISELASSAASAEQITATLSENVYLNIDVDVFDPSIMPAVGTPEPEGMQWQQVLNLLRSVALHKHIVGFDL